MTTGVQGSILLRKLKTGQTAQVSISTTKQLFQLYTKTEKGITCTPDWIENNVQCSVNVIGTGIEVDTVTWYINDTACTSISQCSVSGNVLTIKDNLVEVLNYTSGTLRADISVKDSSSTIRKTEAIRIQQATSSGYIVMIDANQTWVDGTNKAVLTPSVYNNGESQTIGSNDLTVKWFKGNTSTDAISENVVNGVLTVSAKDVNGSQLFVCRAYSSGSEVDAEGITIIDNSDEYHIAADVTQYASVSDTSGTTQSNATSVNVDANNPKSVVTFKVLNKSGAEQDATNWKCTKSHADTMKLIGGSSSSASYTSDTTTADTVNTVSGNAIDVYDGDYISNSGGANHQTEVVCEASCELS